MRCARYNKRRPPREARDGGQMLFGPGSTTTTCDLTTTAAPRLHLRPTSQAAARRIAPHICRLELVVLETLKQAGADGLTDVEMQEHLDLAGDTQRPRRLNLLRRGLIVDSARRRETPSGRDTIVWITSSEGAS